jgi:hypothetical protein
MRIYLALAALVAVIGGLVIYAVVDFNNWQKACLAASGEVEERYEYTTVDTTYTYNANGTIATVIILPRDVYSYHCWVNHQEIEVQY